MRNPIALVSLSLWLTVIGAAPATAVPSKTDAVWCQTPCGATAEPRLARWYRFKPNIERWRKPNVRPRPPKPQQRSRAQRRRRQTACVFHQDFQTSLGYAGNGASMFTIELRNVCAKPARWALCVNRAGEGRRYAEGTISPRGQSHHSVYLQAGQKLRYRYNYCTGIACFPRNPDC